jgi:hypothetical protein
MSMLLKNGKALLLALSLSTPASAASLDVWGLSHHTDQDVQLNEKNYGLGVRHNNIAIGIFTDSMGDRSKYLGSEWMYNDYVGAAGFIMKRPSYKSGQPFIAVLPTVHLGVLRFIYIPKHDALNLKETIAVYLSVQIGE